MTNASLSHIPPPAPARAGHRRPARARIALGVAVSLLALGTVAATGAVPAVAAGSSAGWTYTVARGDTLTAIGHRYGVSISALVAANRLAGADRIRAGQRLLIPAARVAVGHATAGPATDPGQRRYTVVRGDTLWALSRRFEVSIAALVAANHLKVADGLKAGQRITIPPAAVGLPTGPQSPGSIESRLRASPERLSLVPAFVRAARQFGVAPPVLEAITWQESGWQPQVRSAYGAVGVGQLTADTVAFVRGQLIGRSSLNPRVAADNITMSAAFLGWLIRQNHGDVRRAIACYYQGPASVRATGVSADTAHYVDNVMALAARFGALSLGG